MNFSLIVIFLKKNIEKKDVKVINPNPPICKSTSMIICPNLVKYVAVSTTINPVTHTAEVDVNKLSTKEIPSEDTVALGIIKRKVPIIIITIKDRINISPDFNFVFGIITLLNFENL